MNRLFGYCPDWLRKRIDKAGGCITFYEYMDWVLNDPDYGFYSTGRVEIGKDGDFVTSPSLGPDFAELLAVQLIDWFKQLELRNNLASVLTLVEVGPGEGELAFELLKILENLVPANLISKIQFVLVEPNKEMQIRQRKKLKSISKIPIFWKTIQELSQNPVVGILIANELLDALPVERLVYFDKKLYRQGITLIKKDSNYYLTTIELDTPDFIVNTIDDVRNTIGIDLPPVGASDYWSTEWHIELIDWFRETSSIFIDGTMLIIDYMLEAKRYYNKSRSFGTVMSYRNQKASPEVLKNPGLCDLTSHLCIETLIYFARNNGWNCLGECRQGEALLLLGLAEKLHSLRYLSENKLQLALQRRESLLRLVDPLGLGEFRWIAFEKKISRKSIDTKNKYRSIFLEEPSIQLM